MRSRDASAKIDYHGKWQGSVLTRIARINTNGIATRKHKGHKFFDKPLDADPRRKQFKASPYGSPYGFFTAFVRVQSAKSLGKSEVRTTVRVYRGVRGWGWLSLILLLIKRVSFLVGSKVVGLTVAIAHHLSRTGNLVQIYSDQSHNRSKHDGSGVKRNPHIA